MRPRILTVLIACLLPFMATLAQGPGKALLQVDMTGDSTFAVHFEWGNVFIGTAGDRFNELHADGMNLENGETGKPALPTLSTVVSLPRGCSLAISLMEHTEERWDSVVDEGRPLAPVAAAWVKDGPQPEYEPDKATYAADADYRGGEPLEVSHLGTMGRNEIYRITVRPAAYNPVRRSLLVSTRLDAVLEVKGHPLLEPDATLPERYMIVSRPQFREGLQPFVAWKRQEGYEVEEIYADTNKRNAVKALIESRWEDADGRWPKYLLVVGDVAQIQSYIGLTHPQELNNHSTDLYYAEHTGDYLPDALIGRWPVNDTAELRAVVEKTLRYEQCHDLDAAQLQRAILVAGKENTTPAPTTTNGQVNYLKGRIVAEQPTIDTACYHNPDSENQRGGILDDIASGAAFLNYTAHCSTGGWTRPAVGFAAIDTLGCTQPLLYVNNCCLSNAFDGTCFGEQLLRKPQSGAIGVIGATNSTLWNEDYYWAVGPKYPFSLAPAYDSLHPGAFDLFLQGEAATQGALLAAGNLAVSAFGSPYDKFYWEIYCLLGDPSLKPYLGAPQRLSFHAPDTLPVGTATTRISGTPGAIVSAVQGGELLATIVLEDRRSTAIRFIRPLDTLPVVFTATMAQCAPVVDTTYTAMPHGRTVTFRNAAVADTTVDFLLVNLCGDTLYNVAVQLLCDDTTQALFDAPTQHADTLPPHAELPMHTTISVLQWEQRWSGELYAYSITGNVECSPLHLHGRLDGLPPSLTISVLDADTAEHPHIWPDSEYLLQASAEGLCDSMSVTVTALPTADRLITLNSGSTASFTTPDTVKHLHIEAFIARGNYRRNYNIWLTAGPRTDGFENGFASHPWDTSSLRPWIVDTAEHHSGRISLRSAPIGGRQTSDLGIDLLLAAPDSIAFWTHTSSEQNYDRLLFSIDGVKHLELSGNTGWRRCSYPIGSGNHRLLWRYVKDDSGNSGSDCAWIDDVELPAALWDTACGWFGATLLTIEKPSESGELSIRPTVTDGAVWIEAPCETDAELTDILGRHIAIIHLAAGTPCQLDLQRFPAGVYLIKAANGTVKKIIKQ